MVGERGFEPFALLRSKSDVGTTFFDGLAAGALDVDTARALGLVDIDGDDAIVRAAFAC